MENGKIVCCRLLDDLRKCHKQQWYSLSDLLLRAAPTSVVHAARQVLDEADALGDAHLLLLCQLRGQAGLAWRGVVHGHLDLLLSKRYAHMRRAQICRAFCHCCAQSKWSSGLEESPSLGNFNDKLKKK